MGPRSPPSSFWSSPPTSPVPRLPLSPLSPRLSLSPHLSLSLPVPLSLSHLSLSPHLSVSPPTSLFDICMQDTLDVTLPQSRAPHTLLCPHYLLDTARLVTDTCPPTQHRPRASLPAAGEPPLWGETWPSRWGWLSLPPLAPATSGATIHHPEGAHVHPHPSSLAERPLWPVSAPPFVMSPKLSSRNLADPSHPAPHLAACHHKAMMEGSRKHEPPILTRPFEAPWPPAALRRKAGILGRPVPRAEHRSSIPSSLRTDLQTVSPLCPVFYD